MSSRLVALTPGVLILCGSLLGVGCRRDAGRAGPPEPQGQPGPGYTTRAPGVEVGTPMSSVVAITFRGDRSTGATTLSEHVKARVHQVAHHQLDPAEAFPLPPAATDTLRTVPGLFSTVVVKWFDPLSFRNSETDASYDPLKVPRFGSNGDYLAYFGDGWDVDGKAPQFSGSSSAGWMWSNNEYISLPGPHRPRPTAAPKGQFLVLAKWLKSMGVLTNDVTSNTWDEASLKTFTRHWKKQVGGSWFRVVRDPATGEWAVDRGVAARRFDATSDTLSKVVGQNLSGVDHADDGSTLPPGVVSGIHNDCSGGQTPWGTVITAEENVQNAYGDLETAWSTTNNLLFPVGSTNPYAAGATVSPLFSPSLTAEFSPTPSTDADTNTYRHARDMHGYLVEIDPTVPPNEYYGKTEPGVGHRKIGGMGRARWENATFVTGPDWRLLPGEPIVFYSGDDRRGGRVYKFVSRQPYTVGMTRARIRQLLDSGKVYVAHFAGLDNATGMELRLRNPDGTDTVRTPTPEQPGQGRWIELSVDNGTDLAPNAGKPTAARDASNNPVLLPHLTVGQALRDVSYNGIGGFPNDDEVRRALFTVSNKLGVMETNRPEDVEYNPKDPSGTPTLYIAFTEHGATTALDQNGVLATAQPDLAHPGRWMPRARAAADLADRTAERTGGIFGVREADPAHPGRSRTFTYFRAWKGSKRGDPGYDSLYGAAHPDNLAIDREGGVWFATDGNYDASAVADGIYYLDLDPGHAAGRVATPTYGKAFRILGLPSDAEATGPAFTPDMRTLFLNSQHPGEFIYSAWP